MECSRCKQERPSGDYVLRRLNCGHIPIACVQCLAKAKHCSLCTAGFSEDDRASLEEKLRELDAVALFSSAPAARAAPSEPGYVFHVMSMDGGMQHVQLGDAASCLDLKRAVERVFRVKPEHQRLFLADDSNVEIKALKNGTPAPIAGSPLTSGDTLLLLRVYSEHAGQTDIAGAARDKHGNALGSSYDLGVDSAFRGMTIAVLHEFIGTRKDFDFALPEAALREKGFTVHRWSDRIPALEEFSAVLDRSCQLWITSDSRDRGLSDAHIQRIRRFFSEGRGVYIWGDNDPWYFDANRIAKALFGGSMSGCLPDLLSAFLDRSRPHCHPTPYPLSFAMTPLRTPPKGTPTSGAAPGAGGFVPHFITTGVARLYEGNTIATIAPHPHLHALVRGSEGNVVTAIYDRDGRRAVLDGGFTRMYADYWDEAGIARYVKNAAVWLVNIENDY
eukprot:tig00000219_g19494.t1